MKIEKLYLLVILPLLFAFNQLVKPTFSKFGAQKINEAIATNIIFKSTDNGATWNDVSAGLPLNPDRYEFFTDEKELFMHTNTEMYSTKGSAWGKEVFINNPGEIMPCKSGVYAITYSGIISQKLFGTSLWLQTYTNFPKKSLRTIFETSSGAILIGCDNGLFKSNDHGNTWKSVHDEGWVIKIIEENGVLIATNQQGIIRSADGGENWSTVVKEGGVGIDVAKITDGFAAITYNTTSKTRRVRTSRDNGKTWQTIDEGLPASDLIANIKQVGNFLFCGHPKGIYRSIDKGKTWELMLPAFGNQVFNLANLGNVIYAYPRNGGC